MQLRRGFLALRMFKRRKDKVYYLTLRSFCFQIHSSENNI